MTEAAAPPLAPPSRTLAQRAPDILVWGGVFVLLAIAFRPVEIHKLSLLFANSDNMRTFGHDLLRPDFTYWGLYVSQMWLTVQIALWGTTLAVMVASQFLLGLLGGPMDIALFTMRQRRTDPAWIGRAFAVSMALNFIGFPIGAALAGTLAAVSLELAIGAAVVATVIGVVFAILLVPRNEAAEVSTAEVSRPQGRGHDRRRGFRRSTRRGSGR
jgi:hypothetical protein